MCGILGCFNVDRDGESLTEKQFELMLNKLRFRGPDSQDISRINPLQGFLGHTRLSILDLSVGANQPMVLNSKYIVFNGEIYNHRLLRSQLAKFSINWRTSSDTETVLQYIDKFGFREFLNKASGMFALCFVDLNLQKMYLSRDVAGEKPLCYGKVKTSKGEQFYFGSTLDPLFALPNADLKINMIARNQYFKYNYVPAPLSILEGIKKVRPGHFIEIDLQSYEEVSNEAYYNPFHETSHTVSYEDIKTAIEESVSEQLISDVPLGAFLSGGVDSSLITAIAARHKRIKTFTIGFHESNYNEAPYAKAIAKYLNTDHSEYYLSKSEILDGLTNLASAYDEPFADSSQLPTLLLTKYARESLTVALSGDGGDELFAGYNRYKYASNIERILKYNPTRYLVKVANMVPDPFLDFVGNNFVKVNQMGDKIKKLNSIKNQGDLYNEIVSNSAEHIGEFYASQQFPYHEGINGYCKNDFITYLPDDILVKVDRAAMFNSLETRAPFLNRKVINLAFNMQLRDKIRGSNSKLPLKKMLSEYLPEELVERPKMGFGIPVDKWLRSDLFDWADSLINDKKFNYIDEIPIAELRKEWQEFINKQRSSYTVIWNSIMFLAWYKEKFFK